MYHGYIFLYLPLLSEAHAAQLRDRNLQEKLILIGKDVLLKPGIEPELPEWETSALLIHPKGHPAGQTKPSVYYSGTA